jgi:hypothetical protein
MADGPDRQTRNLRVAGREGGKVVVRIRMGGRVRFEFLRDSGKGGVKDNRYAERTGYNRRLKED